MKLLRLMMALSLLTLSCIAEKKPEETRPVDNDAAYRKDIIGYWVENKFSFGLSAFLESGVYKAWIYEDRERKNLRVEIEGRWWIENGLLFNELTKLIPNITGFEIGDVAVEKIIEISNERLVLVDENGEHYTQSRLK